MMIEEKRDWNKDKYRELERKDKLNAKRRLKYAQKVGRPPNGPRSRKLNDFELVDDVVRIHIKDDHYILVDSDDFERVRSFRWSLNKNKRIFYASTERNRASCLLHTLLVQKWPGFEIDHINGNGLDNRKCNLRLVTHQQNTWNSRKSLGKSSVYKGVCFHRQIKKWVSYIYGAKRIHLGLFLSEIEAAQAYDLKAQELFGEYAKLNFPQ